MTEQTIAWLRGLAEKGGKGVVNNIDARCLGRIADELEALKRPAQGAPNRMDKGRAFYLAMYEKNGAVWAANDHKGLWCDMAEDYERRISAVTSTERK